MFTLVRQGALMALLSLSISLPAAAISLKTGGIAEQQLRHIATVWPGRMAGAPAEMMTADYLQQQFQAMGYQSDQRRFKTRYMFQRAGGDNEWRQVNATSTIAARAGKVPQQILVVAHVDSWIPRSESEMQQGMGGLTAQAVDDNAAGIGVMLELAQRLSREPLHYSLRFVALSAGEPGLQGAEDYLSRMSSEEKHNTLLVIDLNQLVIGRHLTVASGAHTPQAVTRQTRDRAVAIAHRAGIAIQSQKTPPANDSPFDREGIPLLTLSASDMLAGKTAHKENRHFPAELRHQAQRDNLAYIDRWLPGRITTRTHDSVAVLLPLIRELANP